MEASRRRRLTRDISQFSFVSRERCRGRAVANKCGRDFLYFALNFYHPTVFNREGFPPEIMDKKKLLGWSVPAWMAWTQLQFLWMPQALKRYGVALVINHTHIGGFMTFVRAILFSRLTVAEALRMVESAVDRNQVTGIDISLGYGGLLDHVLFVYGYDDENLYVFDTHTVSRLEYYPYENHPHVFVLPKSVVRKRWTRFGRVWCVRPTQIS